MPAKIKYLPMGPWPVHVGFTTSPKRFAKEMRRLGIEDVSHLAHEQAGATTHSFEHEDALCCIITALPIKKLDAIDYAAMIAHEAVHVVQAMREALSADDPLGSEAEAYLVQHIVRRCVRYAMRGL